MKTVFSFQIHQNNRLMTDFQRLEKYKSFNIDFFCIFRLKMKNVLYDHNGNAEKGLYKIIQYFGQPTKS